MSYVHHIAGRVRFKFPQLKNQPDLAVSVEKSLRRLDGVKLVQINPVTGSLLIHYDAHDARQKELLDVVEQVTRQFGLGHPAIGQKRLHPASSASGTEQVVDKFIGLMIEKALERSALALVGAIL